VGLLLGGVSMQESTSESSQGRDVDMDVEEQEFSVHGRTDKPKVDSEDGFAMKSRS
jgi:hypothetical protein